MLGENSICVGVTLERVRGGADIRVAHAGVKGTGVGITVPGGEPDGWNIRRQHRLRGVLKQRAANAEPLRRRLDIQANKLCTRQLRSGRNEGRQKYLGIAQQASSSLRQDERAVGFIKTPSKCLGGVLGERLACKIGPNALRGIGV
jgi:hypothetical protein